jgi:hypothetical protein
MTQLHFYVPDEIAKKVRQKARQSGLSTSKYLAKLIKKDVGSGWPETYFAEVVGGWQGGPLERPSQGDFELRDNLDLANGE